MELVKMILDYQTTKTDVLNQKDIYGNTALHLAMYGNNKELIKILIDAGANIDAKNQVSFSVINRMEKLHLNWRRK